VALNDQYRILGVSDRCTLAELKRAFRARAKTLHPDVNKSPDAEARFIEIQKAYDAVFPIVEKRVPPKPAVENPGLTEYSRYLMKQDMFFADGFKVFQPTLTKKDFEEGAFVKCFISAGLIADKEVTAKLVVKPGSTAPVKFQFGKVIIVFDSVERKSGGYNEF